MKMYCFPIAMQAANNDDFAGSQSESSLVVEILESVIELAISLVARIQETLRP
jgi:hypothetical protein